jgi:hypothetical protein
MIVDGMIVGDWMPINFCSKSRSTYRPLNNISPLADVACYYFRAEVLTIITLGDVTLLVGFWFCLSRMS